MKLPLVRRTDLEESQEKMQELSAEYQNYRRRNTEIRTSAYQSGRADAVLAFLPVYDNLIRALEQPCADEAFVTGIRMTLKSLTKAMSSMGVTEIPAMGESFDPAVHEALEHITDPDQGENTIVKVVLTGFQQEDNVIRHALVVVAN